VSTSVGGSAGAAGDGGGGDEPAVVDPADLERALALLTHGTLELEGRLLDASNATLYCTISHGELSGCCVYKPVRGERPLWDFPDGSLAEREMAAYEVSAATGWSIVPPTVLRDGPFGYGMCQLWIEVDESVDLGQLARSKHPGLRRMALFDAVINNADRKGGHLLPTPTGHVFGVDHGVTFHVEDKLRTLLWTWRGRRFSPEERAMLERLRDDTVLLNRLTELLTPAEVSAYDRRIDRLLRTGVFPSPSGDWPAIPWPPF
jgi:uncharacterized repeat protein (TIGR03843 family)